MKQKLCNGEWYKIADTLEKNPIGEGTYIPVTYNYYIQKNITQILTLKTELDTCRRQIITHYGEPCEGGVTIKPEFVDEANRELQALSAIETELDLFTIPLSAFKDIKLTTGELKGLMIMIAPDPSLTEHLSQDPSSFHRTITASPSH